MLRALINVFVALVIVAIGLVAAAFSVAGVINANAAHVILFVAWLVCIFWVYGAEHFRAKPLKQVILVCSATAVVSGGIFIIVDRWIVRSKSAQHVVALEPSTTKSSETIDVGAEIARSRQQTDNYQTDTYPANEDPVMRRTKSGGALCKDPPSHPVLNYWPVSYKDPVDVCHEFPLIDVRRSNGLYSQSAEDWANGAIAKTGDELDVVIYVANGAASQVDDPQRVLARNVVVTIHTETGAAPSHYIDVSASGDNVKTVYSRFVIKTDGNTRLELIEKSARVWDPHGHPLSGGFSAGNNIIKLGDLRSSFDDALFISYRVRVLI
jgi:hypothetical protein